MGLCKGGSRVVCGGYREVIAGGIRSDETKTVTGSVLKGVDVDWKEKSG